MLSIVGCVLVAPPGDFVGETLDHSPLMADDFLAFSRTEPS